MNDIKQDIIQRIHDYYNAEHPDNKLPENIVLSVVQQMLSIYDKPRILEANGSDAISVPSEGLSEIIERLNQLDTQIQNILENGGGAHNQSSMWCSGVFEDTKISASAEKRITPLYKEGYSSMIDGDSFIAPVSGFYILSIGGDGRGSSSSRRHSQIFKNNTTKVSLNENSTGVLVPSAHCGCWLNKGDTLQFSHSCTNAQSSIGADEITFDFCLIGGGSSEIEDDSITEEKLSPEVREKLNNKSSESGTQTDLPALTDDERYEICKKIGLQGSKEEILETLDNLRMLLGVSNLAVEGGGSGMSILSILTGTVELESNVTETLGNEEAIKYISIELPNDTKAYDVRMIKASILSDEECEFNIKIGETDIKEEAVYNSLIGVKINDILSMPLYDVNDTKHIHMWIERHSKHETPLIIQYEIRIIKLTL